MENIHPAGIYVQNELANAKEVIFLTEFMYGLIDGGHVAAQLAFSKLSVPLAPNLTRQK